MLFFYTRKEDLSIYTISLISVFIPFTSYLHLMFIHSLCCHYYVIFFLMYVCFVIDPIPKLKLTWVVILNKYSNPTIPYYCCCCLFDYYCYQHLYFGLGDKQHTFLFANCMHQLFSSSMEHGAR